LRGHAGVRPKIGLTRSSVGNIGLTPVEAGWYGSTAFWPIPAGTTYWVYNLAGYNSGGGDVKGCEKRVLITLILEV